MRKGKKAKKTTETAVGEKITFAEDVMNGINHVLSDIRPKDIHMPAVEKAMRCFIVFAAQESCDIPKGPGKSEMVPCKSYMKLR